MKKNTMMRIASFLLIAVLLSTSAISGTYAKYVTADDASDSARVAKWGVKASVDGTLFYNSYKNQKTNYTANEDTIDITVQAFAEAQKVVAPGTENSDGLTIVLDGAPEVDVDVVFTFVANNEIVLPAGTDYTDYTRPTGAQADGTPIYGNTFDLDAAYYPVVFTLTRNGSPIATGNVAAIQAELALLNKRYDTNQGMAAINGTYELTWAWAFEGDYTANGANIPAATVDKADTYLGNETTLQNIDVTLTLSVTQVN